MSAPEALIFLHVPKTAGTTLRRVIGCRYAARATYVIGNDINADIAGLVGMDEPSRSRIRLLMGHMSFGLHPFLPGGARYVTMLRHPVDRVLSEYRFLKGNPRHPFHARVAPMSLAEYLDSDYTGQAVNGQTRLLSGSHAPGMPGVAGREPLGDADLAKALDNIERHFAIVGLQERFDESLLLMAAVLGWRTWPFYVSRNVTPSASEPDADAFLSHGSRADIEARNDLDMALYRAVSERLKERVDEAGGRFSATLEQFRKWNFRYQSSQSRYTQYRRRLERLAARVTGR